MLLFESFEFDLLSKDQRLGRNVVEPNLHQHKVLLYFKINMDLKINKFDKILVNFIV